MESVLTFFDKMVFALDPIFGKVLTPLFCSLATALIAQGVLVILFHNENYDLDQVILTIYYL